MIEKIHYASKLVSKKNLRENWQSSEIMAEQVPKVRVILRFWKSNQFLAVIREIWTWTCPGEAAQNSQNNIKILQWDRQIAYKGTITRLGTDFPKLRESEGTSLPVRCWENVKCEPNGAHPVTIIPEWRQNKDMLGWIQTEGFVVVVIVLV